MTSFNQKLDNMKESLASLFKSRRTSSKAAVKSSRCSISTSSGGSGSNFSGGPSGTENAAATADTQTANNISTPQNVCRVLHITFDARRQSFDGIPDCWRQYFETGDVVAGNTATILREEDTPNDDSGVSMAINTSAASSELPTSPKRPQELLSLTYDRSNGKFVDLPPHWQERLQRNNLLEPEFQKNPELLVSVFAMMDKELKAMSEEGFCLDKGMYSSSPDLGHEDGCRYVYSIEANPSNSSSEQDLPPALGTSFEQVFPEPCHRRPSLVHVRAVALPGARRDH